MPEPPSMQDIIRGRLETGFVGRNELLARFRENLGLPPTDPRHRFLFNIHGDPGVGKTFLVRQLERIAVEQGARCAVVDERVDDVPGTMAAVAAQIRRHGGRLRAFERRHQRYEERRRALLADPPALTGASLLLARLAVRLGLRAARTVPVVGVAADVVDPDAVVEQADHLHGLLTRVLRSRDDARLVLAPTEELTPVFVEDLCRVASRRPVALFFDAYEQVEAVLDGWLFDLVDGRLHGDLPGSLTITVAGRTPLDHRRWAGLLTEIEAMPLARFTDAEARQLLARREVRDEALVETIFALSGRLPLLVATLAEGSPVDPAAVAGDGSAIEQFLRWQVDDRRREVTSLAALPRQVDEDALAVLAGREDVHGLFTWLSGLSFVTEREGVCRYHEVVRAPLLRLQRQRSPQAWRRHHRRLAELARDSRRALDLSDDDGWADPAWQHCALEETYHRLCATPVAARPAALAGALRAYRAGRPLARRWAEMLRQAGEDGAADRLQRWGARLLAAAGDDEECWPQFVTLLLDEAPLEPADRALALEQRAECHVLERRFDAALADLGRAIELHPASAGLFAARAQTHRLRGRLEDALRDFDRAVALAPEGQSAIAGRGVILRRLGRYEEALADLTRAIELRPSDDWAVAHRGETHRLMGRHHQAVADFTEAIRLNHTYDFAFANRALARRALGQHRLELADLDRALQLSPQYEWAYAQRAVTLRRLGRHLDAIADLDRALELDPGDEGAIANRGVTYRQLGRYEEALADLDLALELEPEDVWTLVNRGITLRQAGRYEAAVADLDRAIARQRQNAWAIANRAEALRLLGRHREAVDGFDQALALQPGSAWSLARRGEARRRLGDVEGALSDFDHALRLDGGDGVARFGRGLLLLAEGRRDEAAGELQAAVAAGRRSLEMRPGDPAALLRLAVYEAVGGGAAPADLCTEALARGAGTALIASTVDELRHLARVAPESSTAISPMVDLLSAATPAGGEG